jgi:hypothetical protein
VLVSELVNSWVVTSDSTTDNSLVVWLEDLLAELLDWALVEVLVSELAYLSVWV